MVSTMILAFWRLRRSFTPLLLTGVGVLAAAVLVCTVPLYSQVATTAALRSTLLVTPTTAEIVLHTHGAGISTDVAHDIPPQLFPLLPAPLHAYLSGPPQFSLQTQSLTVLSPKLALLQLVGSSMQDVASHVKLLRGRLPNKSSDDLEIALTETSTQGLGVGVGSQLTVPLSFFTQPPDPLSPSFPFSERLHFHVVGIFSTSQENDPFWHGNDFQPLTTFVNGQPQVTYQALFSNETLLTFLTNLGAKYHSQSNAVFSEEVSNLYWYYRLDTSRLSIDQLDDFIHQCQTLQLNAVHQEEILSSPPLYPYMLSIDISTPATGPDASPGILELFRTSVGVARIPVMITFCLILLLILAFVATMTQFLVESQEETLALLRSRGASSLQILGILLTQSVYLCLLALIFSPLLAFLVVALLTRLFLFPHDYGAFGILSHHPWQAIQDVSPFALSVVFVTLLVMAFAVYQASRLNILTYRREMARKTSFPFWQRLNLDVAAIIIAVTGYALSVYITPVASTDTLNPVAQALVASPLSLLAPAFLVIAGVLFIFRFAAPLLHVGTRLAVQSHAAAPLLALAQMARAPQRAVNMALLLAFAISFALFTLVFPASQEQYISNVAAYQAGADLSGVLSNTVPASSMHDETATFRHLPGVLSATVGYAGDAVSAGNSASIPLQIRAVDASTFAQTAIWTSQDSKQTLSSLMAQLSAQQSLPRSKNVVPAIVDAFAWKLLNLHVGATFSMQVSQANNATVMIPCIAIAQVQHIPTINDSTLPVETLTYHSPGGILVDYQNYATIYQEESGSNLPINYVWLRTQDSAILLSRLRNVLGTTQFNVNPLYDRRALIATLSQDPLLLDLMGVLTIGTATALLLTFVGSLITSWLGVRLRLTNFALLRALGTSMQQIVSVLLWEQGLIYLTALLLGALFGMLLSVTFVPVLLFSNVPVGSNETSEAAFYAIQHILSVNLVLPGSLAIAFGALVITYLLALWIMIYGISKPLVSQVLRLNED